MSDSVYSPYATRGLPDPQTQGYFYDGVPGRRLLAFLVDSVLIGIAAVVLLPFTVFTALFFFPFFAVVVGFFYRSASLAAFSATPGMWLAGIEIRNHRGARLDGLTALMHAGLFSLFLGTVVLLVVSAVLMLTTPRKQGLHDMFLGTAAIRRPA